MASDFVRKVKGIRNIDILSPNITTENDLISTIDGEVYVATNKGYRRITGIETKDIKQLKTDVSNVKIQSDSNTLNISDNTDDIETNISEIETLKKDTSNWQKYKLTENNGDRISKSNLDVLSLESGFYNCWNISGVPLEESSMWFIDIYSSEGYNSKIIKATLGYNGDVYQRTIYRTYDSGWNKLNDGEKGDAFQYEDFTTEQLESLKGPKGDAFQYEDFTPEQLESLEGKQGPKGDSVLATPKIYTRDEYNQLETKEPNTLYFISEV